MLAGGEKSTRDIRLAKALARDPEFATILKVVAARPATPRRADRR
jgi:hypothetical protein